MFDQISCSNVYDSLMFVDSQETQKSIYLVNKTIFPSNKKFHKLEYQSDLWKKLFFGRGDFPVNQTQTFNEEL